MPSITIPESAYPAIQDLVRLSQDDFEALVKALSDATPAISLVASGATSPSAHRRLRKRKPNLS